MQRSGKAAFAKNSKKYKNAEESSGWILIADKKLFTSDPIANVAKNSLNKSDAK